MEASLHRRLFLVALVASTLVGCASSTIDPQEKAAVLSVYVEPARISKVTVFAPTPGEVSAGAGRVPSTVSEATSRLQRLIDTRVQLAQYVHEQAQRELVQKGYRVIPDSTAAGARLQLTVNHALSVATGRNDERGLAMTVNADLVRAADGRRLVFAIANQVKEADRASIRMASYAEWLSNEELVLEQYRSVSKALIARALEGL